jgi:hypothetical protein
MATMGKEAWLELLPGLRAEEAATSAETVRAGVVPFLGMRVVFLWSFFGMTPGLSRIFFEDGGFRVNVYLEVNKWDFPISSSTTLTNEQASDG